MKLLKLNLHNFKGIRSLEIDTNGGENVDVFGDNATGKTTLADAANWLLFDKDSHDRKDFSIKELDTNGQVKIHRLNHEVEGVFDINRKSISLKKVYSEKWTKKRGSATDEFTGHETSYFIDGVPKPKKDYDAFVGGIVHEDVFKLLTNPLFFNERLHWQKRREALLQICGNISDAEVIAANKELSELPAVLNGRTIEDHRKVLAARRTEINKEIEKIPVRIDETLRGMPDVAGLPNKEVLSVEIKSLKTQADAKRKEIARVEAGGEMAEQQKALRETESRIIDITNRHRAENGDKAQVKQNEITRLNSQISSIETQMAAAGRTLEANNSEAKRCNASREALRSKWQAVYDRKFEFIYDSNCPACGQELPESQIDEARAKAQEQFNAVKSKELEAINVDGKSYKHKTEELQAANQKIQTDIERLQADKEKLAQSVTDLRSEIKAMGESPDIESNPNYVQALREKEKVQTLVDNLATSMQGVVRGLRDEVNLIEQDIAVREKSIANLDRFEKDQSRIKELECQEKALSSEFEKLESELYLTEQFIRAKVNMLEERINGRFKIARFKLFDQQINGGLSECCETMYNGVPYSDMNNAARINVGLDIINTLSEHYGFVAPIWIDNAEAVTKLTETAAQIIRLIVSEPEKTLRVVVNTNRLMEAG